MTLFNENSPYSRENGNNSYPTNKKIRGSFLLHRCWSAET